LFVINGLDHRKGAFSFFTLVFFLMYAGVFMQVNRYEAGEELNAMVVLNSLMIVIFGSLMFNIQFYFNKLDIFIMFE